MIAALETANSTLANDTINLEADCFYSLAEAHNTTSGANGLPVIGDAATAGTLTINGNGATITALGFRVWLPAIINTATTGTSTIDGNEAIVERSSATARVANFRIFMVAAGGDLTLESITIQNGNLPWQNGGGIFNAGTLTISNSAVSGNAAIFGGGIFNTGTLTVNNSTFSNNAADDAGGGINSNGSLLVTGSTFTNNTASLSDNILVAEGTATVTGNTFTGDLPFTCPAFPYTVPASDTTALIDAIHCANSSPGDNVIDLTNSTYTLTAVNNDGDGSGDTGLPVIANAWTAGALTINGNGATLERSNAGGTPDFRLLTLVWGSSLALDTITVQNGNLPRHGGGIMNSFGTLIVTNSTIANNATGADGGGINSGGTLTVTNTLFSGNTAAGLGGGILVGQGTATVTNSTFFDNSTFGFAGGSGILNGGCGCASSVLMITGSTFSNNYADGAGGALFNGGTGSMTVTNSTLANNTAFNGGGIWNGGTMTVTHSTLSGNTAENEGGGFALYGGTLNFGHTIAAGNSANFSGSDIFGTINSLGYNVIGSTASATITGSFTGNLTNAAASPLNLGPLQDNGGPTQTMALAAGSVAINAGDPAFTAPPDFDQRGTGFPRKNGGTIDIGAYESP